MIKHAFTYHGWLNVVALAGLLRVRNRGKTNADTYHGWLKVVALAGLLRVRNRGKIGEPQLKQMHDALSSN